MTTEVISPSLTIEQKATQALLTMKMTELGVDVKPLPGVNVGPLLSVYRFIPNGSTKVSQIENLSKDLSLILGKEILIKRMPGETSISFMIPNEVRGEVKWLDTASAVWNSVHGGNVMKIPGKIPLGFGVDFMGKPFIEDLTSLPHLLIAGTTGSGKSTLVKSLIASTAHTLNSSTLQLVLSDTKGVEFNDFSGLPHLLFPIATSPFQTLEQMDFLIEETERRLRKFPSYGVNNIHDFNQAQSHDGISTQYKLSLIMMIIDECADIMDVGKLADAKLGKIAQKSRAAGIYIIACTQRPSADVIKGSIKANFPARLTFRLPSSIDSRVVIGTEGAEHLLMRGDMLYVSPNRPGLHRIHAPLASKNDIHGVVEAAIRKE